MRSIVIIGGGPAGLALAAGLSLSGSNEITVIEKSTYDGNVSGEHLQAGVVPILVELKIPTEILFDNSTPCDGIAGKWANRSIRSESIFTPYGPDTIVHRPQFEKALVRLLEERGVKFCLGATYAAIGSRDISLKNKKIPYDLLFDCSGRTSRTFDNTRLIFDNLLGVSFYLPSGPNGDAEVRIESAERGWWYHTRNRMWQIVTFFTDADIYKEIKGDLQRELDKTEVIRTRCGRLNGSRHVSPAYTSILKTNPNGIYQVGDSYFSLDPLSSQGMYKAFAHAAKVSKLVLEDRFEDSVTGLYEEQRRDFVMQLRLRTKFYDEGLSYYGSEFYRRRVISMSDLGLRISD
jgi:flavin-dependent dehydrogenase